MKKHNLIIFRTSNETKPILGVVVVVIRDDRDDEWYLVYADHKLFGYRLIKGMEHPVVDVWTSTSVSIPECDLILYNERKKHESNNPESLCN